MCLERLLEMVSTILADPLITDHGNERIAAQR